ncbi:MULTISPECIES: PHB depolymerase family esterase [Micromonospora]|uniref:PHB depolymerase esterase n=1 Tax=Micromonospora solifontis TaxID=2487138 RepID=A0ABX9WD25_9ACTN|nr:MULTISPECIES: PHB depolymerase family esterase [Micromonospora]NES16170.1 PHB depolymerase family esterase [Micromonospora sp. PPF5-17B]NES38029.1 PHB depolymerase family esterase [Micromonospora solifontis]NES57657.1 PHB depolymerase family esterase [Micromonospora sp. PPF5-6]RNL97708.1 PHB depolymerase esterase [Micromonospora solifontis]
MPQPVPARRLRRLATAALAVLLALLGAPAAPARAASGTWFYGTYANLAGTRDYHGYVPSTYRPGTPMPLLVALHGCTENDVGFDLLTGLSARAEQRGFLVVFPDQSTLANPAQCWNWPLSINQHRGWGEPSIIAGITDLVRSRWTVDPDRVYVTGVSAGGVMSMIMAVTYPDRYAAAASVAGCEYECDVLRLRSPDQAGLDAWREMGSRARPVPVLVFQGTADLVVAPATADRIVGQWAQTDDLALDGLDDGDVTATPTLVERGQVPGGRTYTHSVHRGPDGTVLIEEYLIDGAGHVYPGGCGCSLYGDPSGPDASGLSWDFFLAHPRR